MITLVKTYSNGHQRVFTVTAAQFEDDSAIVTTAEDGDVAISANDHPDLWAQLMAAAGVSPEIISLLALFATIVVHLVSTVWWAASVTRRIEHIERWVTHHEHTAERLVALEQRIEHLTSGIARIEQFLREKF